MTLVFERSDLQKRFGTLHVCNITWEHLQNKYKSIVYLAKELYFSDEDGLHLIKGNK